MTSASQPSAGEDRTSEKAEAPQSTWAMAGSRRGAPLSNWLAFAGTILVLVGVFNVIDALTAFLRTDYYVVTEAGLLVFNYAAWGWIWLVVGVLQVATGIGAMIGQTWARVTGVVLAGLAAIGHLAFLNAFPMWSVLVIAMSVLVIYALVTPPQGATGT
ncbi:DUF7144 family membrane protein [Saccharopolyspora taberi]|uniref:DUF7144 domain-containing protein n=1 Tax=Saccharopolyspora taberi TaxID=60895 RepID=A0ABN3V8D5_9PSEU